MKLPAFYLLDAMSKNVFDPYARLFAPVVVRLYIDTYQIVDQATRYKMEDKEQVQDSTDVKECRV